MMYLSHTNDVPNKTGDDYILAVVLDDDFLANIESIHKQLLAEQYPYPITSLNLQFPTDKVRLLENWSRDELLEDRHVYTIRGSEDPLDYYRYTVHDYVPREDFWHESKVSSVTLDCYNGYSFGFSAVSHDYKTIYNGYGKAITDWRQCMKG